MNRRDLLKLGAAAGLSGMVRPGWAQAVTAAATDPAAPLLLNSNENALGLAPAARQAVASAISSAHRYPDAAREELAETLAERHGVSTASVVLGNGSTEILQMAVQAGWAPGATLVLADPTFEAVLRYARPLDYKVVKVPLDAGHGHDLERMKKAVEESEGPAVVYLCNPNNPTATLTATAAIDEWIGGAPESVLFLVDEAYFEYVRSPGYRSAERWIAERPNVVVARTFSKIYAMAGLRLGYALAHPDTARRLEDFRSGDNANALALAAALAALDDRDLVARSRASNEAARKIVHGVLDELGLDFLPSHANFLMHRIAGDLGLYIDRMRDAGIHVGRRFPAYPEHNRLSLGLPEEMERFATTLRRFRREGWI